MQYYVLPWHLKLRGLQKAYSWVPLLSLNMMHWERLPTWLVSLSAGLAASHLILNQMGFTPLSAHKLFKQANHILLWEPRVTTPSWYDKAWLPQPLLVHCVPEYNPCSLPWYAVSSSPGLWVYVTDSTAVNLIYPVSGVLVFGHLILFRVGESLPYQWG